MRVMYRSGLKLSIKSNLKLLICGYRYLHYCPTVASTWGWHARIYRGLYKCVKTVVAEYCLYNTHIKGKTFGPSGEVMQ